MTDTDWANSHFSLAYIHVAKAIFSRLHAYIHLSSTYTYPISAYIHLVGAYIHLCLSNILATRSSRRQHRLAPVSPPPILPEAHSSPPSSPSTFSSSDSSASSNDDILMAYAALAPNANAASMHDMASIKFHEGHKTAPILTAGNVSLTIIA